MGQCAGSFVALHLIALYVNKKAINSNCSLFFSEVRPGRCPSSGTQGSQQSCDGDSECPGNEKCCESKCTTPTSIGRYFF